MKQLLACLAILIAFNVTAQIDGFQLPYNPDFEQDGYIGVNDVLELLQLYGSEFNASNSYFLDDSTAMAIEVGELNFYKCKAACASLPGSWRVATELDLGRFWDSLPEVFFWVSDVRNDSGEIYQVDVSGFGASFLAGRFSSNCLCATEERPKVEYTACSGASSYANYSNIQSCVESKVLEGWLPLGSIQLGSGTVAQSFWRWAD